MNVAGLLASPLRGLAFATPVAVVALLALRPAWRAAPDWCKGAALGGVAYLLLQARINTFEGGGNFYGSRLTLEPLILWTPLLFLAVQHLWSRDRRWLVLVGGWSSVAIGTIGATAGHLVIVPLTASPWTTWQTWTVVRGAGAPAILILALLVTGLLLSLLLLRGNARRAISAQPTALAAQGAAVLSMLDSRNGADERARLESSVRIHPQEDAAAQPRPRNTVCERVTTWANGSA